jgi:hypothetical protein
MEQNILRTFTKELSFDNKRQTITSLSELKLIPYLASLLKEMEPSSIVEITHGNEELGKDLVMLNETKFGRQVIGIVVKTGIISGKTMGKVEEIVSQVEQCFQYPAILRTVEGALPIGEVWVITSGVFTRKGQQRIGSFKKNMNVRLFDIKWLVEHFTEYYPYIFFQNKQKQRQLIGKLTSHRINSTLHTILGEVSELYYLAKLTDKTTQQEQRIEQALHWIEKAIEEFRGNVTLMTKKPGMGTSNDKKKALQRKRSENL